MSNFAELKQAIDQLKAEVGGLRDDVNQVLAAATGGGLLGVGELNAGALKVDADAQTIFAKRWNSAAEAERDLDPINAATVTNGGQVYNWGPAFNEGGKFMAFTNPSAEATNFFFQGPLYKAAAAKKAAQPDTRPADVDVDAGSADRQQRVQSATEKDGEQP